MNRWQDKEEKIARLFTQAEDVIKQTFQNEKGIKEYLDFHLQVPGYSVHNTAMMKAQRPDAQLAGSYQFWKEHGLYVKGGERGMAILVPVKGENGNTAFTLRYIFDINQTNADEEKKGELLQRENTKLLKEKNYDILFTAVHEAAAENKVSIRFLNEHPKESIGEAYYKDNTVFLSQTGETRRQAEQAMRLFSMVLLERKENWTSEQISLQADMVQYLLCRHYGLDISEIHFTDLAHQNIQISRIQEKKKMLGDAFSIADFLTKQIDKCLDAMIKQKLPEKMSLEDFLGRKGLLFPISGYMLDKVKIPNGMTERERKRLGEEAWKAADSYYEKRTAAIEEYNELVKQGRIIPKTTVERELDVAHGHPDNESVQAARRMLEKRGINWITGKPIAENNQVPESKKEKKTVVPENANKGKIEDFGKKIGGARKDLWKERGLDIVDIAEMNEAEAAKYITKDNIWKKPDYMQMIKEGVPVRVAYFIKEVRNSLPAKVTYSYMDTTLEQRQKRQEDYISLIRDVKEQLLNVKTERDIFRFYDKFVESGIYVERITSYAVKRTEKGYAVTNKMLKAMQIGRMGLEKIDYKIEKEQFGVPAEEKLPKGFSVHYLAGKQEYLVLKGRRILADGFKSEKEAAEAAKELSKTQTTSRKKKFIPEQLEQIVRDGPSNGITPDKPANGNMYIETFGFSGGEFGNWMNETDRQASLDMGYDALCDLADALELNVSDISLGNRLSIAFGSRGHGSAVAHYEPMREVINLTKMRGAGSLAHEWGHAFDDIMGKQLGLNDFMTESFWDKRVPASMKRLMDSMKYRPATEEEIQMAASRSQERDQKRFDNLLQQILPAEKLDETQRKEWQRLKEEIISVAKERSADVEKEEQDGNGRVKWICEKTEELSGLKKSVTGHIITKDIRDQLYYVIYTLECDFGGTKDTLKVETDFYKNSVKADSLYSKEDKGYWHSNVEMFARAFACYVHDKLPWRSDYLCGHSELAMVIDFSKEKPELIKTFPEGKERERINKCFDELFAECKKLGLLMNADKERKTKTQVKTIEQVQDEEIKKAVGMDGAEHLPIRKRGKGR